MGTFASNLLIYGSSLHAVKGHYRQVGRPAYVAPLDGKAILVAEGPIEGRDSEAESLSRSLSCATLICDIFDSDVLIVELIRNGERMDYYVSNEEMLQWMSMDVEFPRSMPFTPAARARLWCECLGKPEHEARLTEVLAAPNMEEYVFVEEYQAALWQALELPTAAIGVDFRYLVQGVVPSGLDGVVERVE